MQIYDRATLTGSDFKKRSTLSISWSSIALPIKACRFLWIRNIATCNTSIKTSCVIKEKHCSESAKDGQLAYVGGVWWDFCMAWVSRWYFCLTRLFLIFILINCNLIFSLWQNLSLAYKSRKCSTPVESHTKSCRHI